MWAGKNTEMKNCTGKREKDVDGWEKSQRIRNCRG